MKKPPNPKGTLKRGTSRPGKSPKLRLHERQEAEKNERKAPPPLPHASVAGALREQR